MKHYIISLQFDWFFICKPFCYYVEANLYLKSLKKMEKVRSSVDYSICHETRFVYFRYSFASISESSTGFKYNFVFVTKVIFLMQNNLCLLILK